MAKKIVIVSGGKLENEFVREILGEPGTGCVIGVDKGMEFLFECGIVPSYLVGDFDSGNQEILEYYREQKVPIRTYNPVKDASDTEIAIRLALTLGCSELIILGATGGRIDHLWANVQCLSIPFRAGVDAKILDARNRIRLIGGDTVLKKADAYGPYFSLFPLGENVRGLTITGAAYPLKGHELSAYDSLCVSNQFASDEVKITFRSGTVILIESRD